MIPKANYHTHTTYCDGLNTPEEMVCEAIKQGLLYLGFSGHMDADVHMDFDAYVKKIRQLQKQQNDTIQILCGVELDNLYNPKYAKEADYVIGSTHFLDVDYLRPLSIDDTPEDVVLLCNEFFNGDYYKLCRSYYELEATILDRFQCTFIGHFDLVTKFNNTLHFVDETDKRYLYPAFESMEYLVSKGIPFEINTRQVSKGKIYPCKTLLQRLNDLHGEIIINSDAHRCEEITAGFQNAVAIAKECGFTYTNYLVKKNDHIEFIKETI